MKKSWFQCCETQLVLLDQSRCSCAIDVKMDGPVFQGRRYFKILGLFLTSKLGWGSYIVSWIVKTASKKIGALTGSMKLLHPEVALYLDKPTIRPCLECFCHVWAGASSCYLDILDKLEKRLCRTVGPSLVTSLESLAHRQKVASSSPFCRYHFDGCLSKLAVLVPLPPSYGRSTRYSNKFHSFSRHS